MCICMDFFLSQNAAETVSESLKLISFVSHIYKIVFFLLRKKKITKTMPAFYDRDNNRFPYFIFLFFL